MELSVLLAQLLGIYLLIAGVAVLVRRKELSKLTNQFVHDEAHLLVYGAVAVIIGLLLVLSHNVWEEGLWRTVITLVGWVILLKGGTAMLFPSLFKKVAKSLSNTGWYTFGGAVALVVGAYLVYQGFGLGT